MIKEHIVTEWLEKNEVGYSIYELEDNQYCIYLKIGIAIVEIKRHNLDDLRALADRIEEHMDVLQETEDE